MSHRPHLPRPRVRRAGRLFSAAVVTATLAVLGTAVGPTTAQTPPPAPAPADPADLAILERTLALAPDAPPSPDDVFVAPAEARATETEKAGLLLAAVDRADNAQRDAFLAAGAAIDAKAAETKAVTRRDTRKKQLAYEEKQLSDLTVRAFVTGGDYQIAAYRDLLSGDTTDPAAGATIMFEQVVNHQEKVTVKATEALAAAQKALTAARATRAKADDDAAHAATLSTDRARERDDAAKAHADAVDAVTAAVERLRHAPQGQPVPLEVPIIGMPRLTGEDLTSWFEQSFYHSKLATPISDIANWFIEEGRAEGIRGDIAFAQAVLETGGFTNRDSVLVNNFSGIGHCDLCPSGWPFPTARDGVRAQIQLLKSYAIRQPEYTEPLVDRRLRGPAGCCPTWGHLTTVWATDPGYGPKVMLIYQWMVDHALARRAAGLGLDPPA